MKNKFIHNTSKLAVTAANIIFRTPDSARSFLRRRRLIACLEDVHAMDGCQDVIKPGYRPWIDHLQAIRYIKKFKAFDLIYNQLDKWYCNKPWKGGHNENA
jgi:hypothetical protein